MDRSRHETGGEIYQQWGRAFRTELFRLCQDSPYDFADHSLFYDLPNASLDDLSIVSKASQYEKDGVTVHLECAAGQENVHGTGILSRNNIDIVITEHFDENGNPLLSRSLCIKIDEVSGQIGYTLRDVQVAHRNDATNPSQFFDMSLKVGRLAKLPEIEKIRNLVGNEDPLEPYEYNEAMAILESLTAEDAVKPSFVD